MGVLDCSGLHRVPNPILNFPVPAGEMPIVPAVPMFPPALENLASKSVLPPWSKRYAAEALLSDKTASSTVIKTESSTTCLSCDFIMHKKPPLMGV